MPASDPTAPATDRLTRATRTSLIINGVLHTTGMVSYFVGLDPHAAPLARRAVAAGVAGVVAMFMVAQRLRQSPSLIVVPLVFVLGNLVSTICDFASSGDAKALGPAAPETFFLALYALFAVKRARSTVAA